ncbi:MAG: hypothetical protein PF541_03045 [Prolixibacteraceae bacterium]|jgi:transcriptional regulator with XRE-family HTH domain|nr:hypothetical protein [Prolixibacteraceae bacterium]
MKPNSNVGEKIQQIRQLKKLSIEELATRSQLNKKQINLIEEN